MKTVVYRRDESVLFVCALLILSVPLFAHIADQPFIMTVATRIVIFALLGVSLDLIVGYGGLVSLGHAAFYGVGAYAAGIFTHHALSEATGVQGWSLPADALLIWPISLLAAAVLALPLGALALRTTGFNFIMITLAFGQMIFFVFVSLKGYGGDDGLRIASRYRLAGISLDNPTYLYYVCAGCLAAYLFLCDRLVNSRFGMVLQAARQNQSRARSLGYRTYWYQLVAFVIAACGAALAGTLSVNHARYVNPDLMTWTRSAEVLVIVILGGKGTLRGAVLGAAALLLLEEMLIEITEHWQIILGPVLLVAVLFARRGLWGLLVGSKAALRG